MTDHIAGTIFVDTAKKSVFNNVVYANIFEDYSGEQFLELGDNPHEAIYLNKHDAKMLSDFILNIFLAEN